MNRISLSASTDDFIRLRNIRTICPVRVAQYGFLGGHRDPVIRSLLSGATDEQRESSAALVEEIRHAFTISFHKERAGRLSCEGRERGAGFVGSCDRPPATEVIYEGNRTAHAPHDVLPSRQWSGGVRIDPSEDSRPPAATKRDFGRRLWRTL